MSNKNYSILVNSCDGFEDCWAPFFTLFNRYWPECDAKIYLNTETKKWSYEGLNISCTRVQENTTHRLTWSECLIQALDQIETPLVLYFQEDYFIHQPVRHLLVKKASEYMMKNTGVGHIALTRHGSLGPFEKHEEDWLLTIGQKALYRISTQAALWRVETLRSYLESSESGWMFEIYGTWRSHKRTDIFLSAKWQPDEGGPAIEYLHTGIVKGKWLREIEPVFVKNCIDINYDRRGFYQPKSKLFHKVELAQKLLKNPRYLLKQLL